MTADAATLRARFEDTERGVGDWMAAATAYAASHEGHELLLDERLPLARDLGDIERLANLHAALLRGEQQQAESEERTRSTGKPTRVADKRELDHYVRLFGVAAAQATRDHARHRPSGQSLPAGRSWPSRPEPSSSVFGLRMRGG